MNTTTYMLKKLIDVEYFQEFSYLLSNNNYFTSQNTEYYL